MFRTYEKDTATGGVVLAGALAFRVFLFIVPYVFVLVVGFGIAADATQEDPTALARKAGIAGLLAGAIGSTNELSLNERIVSIVIGVFALYLAARGLLKVLRVVLVSWYLPNRATRWQEVVPGAALFGVGVLVLHVVTIYWIAHVVENKTDTYGAIGSALALLLWAYLLGRLMAAGAVLNMSLWEQHHEHETPASEATA